MQLLPQSCLPPNLGWASGIKLWIFGSLGVKGSWMKLSSRVSKEGGFYKDPWETQVKQIYIQELPTLR